MSKRLEILETALKEMRERHKSLWDTYGSELCAGDMSRQEKELEDKIKALKKEIEEEDTIICGGKDVTFNRLRKRAKELKKG